MSCLPKPVLRGQMKRAAIKTLVGGFVSAIIGGAIWHFTVKVPRREAFENFLKTYDADAHYKELVKYGMVYSPKDNDD